MESKKNKAVIGESAKYLSLLRNWLHQGFFYLDRTERFFRIFLEVIPICFLAYYLSAILPDLNHSVIWIFSFIVVHTVNWVFNDNWWACILFAFPNMRNMGEEKTCEYLNNMAIRLKKNDSISGVMIFGSVSRGEWHSRSDLDIRLLRRTGIVNGVIAVLLLLRERFIAFLSRQPLDIYLADDIDFLKKMRVDEYPIFLKKDDARLERLYPKGDEQIISSLTS